MTYITYKNNLFFLLFLDKYRTFVYVQLSLPQNVLHLTHMAPVHHTHNNGCQCQKLVLLSISTFYHS